MIVTAFRVLLRTQDEVGRLEPREARDRDTTSSMHLPARSEVPISHDVSKSLVEGAHQSDDAADLSSPANEDIQIQGATSAPQASTPSFFSSLAGIVGTGRKDNVTSRHPTRDPSGDNLHIPVRAMSPQVQLEHCGCSSQLPSRSLLFARRWRSDRRWNISEWRLSIASPPRKWIGRCGTRNRSEVGRH